MGLEGTIAITIWSITIPTALLLFYSKEIKERINNAE
jgi:hypothetical protein